LAVTAQLSEVLVILDPVFGERLREFWPGRAIWIVTTPTNEPVTKALSAGHAGSSHLTGISELTCYDELGPEARFLRYLPTIDLHHGPMSTRTPYMAIKVMGLTLTASIESALAELGFTEFDENPDGFDARRTAEEAARIRD
jgi:hypothetical protein